MIDLKEKDMNPGSRYKMEKVRGKGSYGLVAAYDDTKTNEKVAIKMLHQVEDEIDAKRILREIMILHHFKHENIIDLKRVVYRPIEGKDFGEIYLVTNLMDVDLYQLIQKNREELSDDHIQYIMYQIFRAMKYLHSRNIIHRDIKPSNILADESCDIRICDFGFAREAASEVQGMTEYVVTRFYRAPEIMLDSQNYSKAVDIWSIGCTFYELITGTPLFKAKNYLDLVKLMIDVLGKPSPQNLSFISSQHALKFIQDMPDTPKRMPTVDIEYENPLALDLINKCLEFNPAERIDINGALEHPYFEGLHDSSDEPSFSKHLNFDFEKSQEHTLSELKLMIIKEINSVNKENKEPLYDVEEIKKRLE